MSFQDFEERSRQSNGKLFLFFMRSISAFLSDWTRVVRESQSSSSLEDRYVR